MRITLHGLRFSILIITFYLSAVAQAESLPFNSVSESSYNARNCRFQFGSEKAVRIKNINRIASVKGELPSNFEVGGIKFVNESPELVYRFKQLTTALDFFGQPDPKNQINIKQKLKGAQCTKVMCALNSLFGTERAEKMLYLLMNYNVNTSPYAYTDSSMPTAQELDIFLEAFDLVPPFLLKIQLNKKMIKFSRGYSRGENSENVIANATMEFFDLWDNIDKWERVYSVYHELSHNWAYTALGSLDNSNEWLKITGWKRTGPNGSDNEWTHSASNDFISKYATTNPAEDFAETSSAYRLNPLKLKSVSINRYNYMRDYVYSGIEFDNVEHCQGAQKVSKQFQNKILDYIKLNAEKIPQTIVAECRIEYGQFIINNEPSKAFKYTDCIQSEIIRWGAGQILSKSLNLLPRYLYDPFFDTSIATPNSIIESLKRASKKDILGFCNSKTDDDVIKKLMAEKYPEIKSTSDFKNNLKSNLEYLVVSLSSQMLCK